MTFVIIERAYRLKKHNCDFGNIGSSRSVQSESHSRYQGPWPIKKQESKGSPADANMESCASFAVSATLACTTNPDINALCAPIASMEEHRYNVQSATTVDTAKRQHTVQYAQDACTENVKTNAPFVMDAHMANVRTSVLFAMGAHTAKLNICVLFAIGVHTANTSTNAPSASV